MDRHKCRLCFRNFNNGKALGAHMRSHMIKLGAQKGMVPIQGNGDFHAPKNASNHKREGPNDAKSASNKQKGVLYATKSASDQTLYAGKSTSGQRKEALYATKSVSDQAPYAVRSASDQRKEALYAATSASHQAIYAAKIASNQEQEQEPVHSYSSTPKEEQEKYPKTEHSSSVLQDDESETEPSKQTQFAKVFKRARNSRTPKIKTDEHSSSLSSDLTPEENGAYILMMLSRDSWEREPRKPIEIQYSNVEKVVKKSKVRGKYKCDNCDMSFKSYQALGGHNAIHTAAAAGQRTAAAAAEEEKIFQCPYCEKAFASGQALGGHKRSHFSYGVFKPGTSSRTVGEKLGIKLNGQLSAYDDQISETETSAASDAEI